jgi:hypothetical protein
MFRLPHILSLGVALAFIPAALADEPAQDLFKDRADFLPKRKYVPVEGKVVGLLLHGGQPVLSTEGRSGPPDQLCFSAGANSYRWVYVPVKDAPTITNLKVPSLKGEQVYPALDMARPKSVQAMGITGLYTLVEVEVNGGAGSPAHDSFVATGFKVLEGTKDFPLKTADAIAEVRKRYDSYVKDQGKAIETAMNEAQTKALKERKPTGPRETSEVMYVTWMPETKTLQLRFLTKISDGAYTFVQGGIRPRPIPLPVPPQANGQNPPQAQPAIKRFPPPPPRFRTKVGTTFGIEFGIAYEVSRDGTVTRSRALPIQSFQEELRMPVGVGVPVNPLPLPPAPRVPQQN